MKTTAGDLKSRLVGNIWNGYLRRVPYARKYKQLVESGGGKLVFDHLAFRTLNTRTGEQPSGITALSHFLKLLGYREAGTYKFKKQKITAVHYENEVVSLPRIFVSQLEVGEFPDWAVRLIQDVVHESPYVISDMAIELMNCIAADGSINEEAAEILLEELTGYFRRPWKMPPKDTMLRINDVSQYAAWVLLHGNSVNHFAASINDQNMPEWPDLESTCVALAAAGIPMKDKIEGDKGSLLRQSATRSVVENHRFPDLQGDFDEMEWTYAYLELTERGYTGQGDLRKLYSGFITGQAAHLFKMTQTRSN